MTTAGRDELLADLLAAPLDRFVEERNRLARELRSSGDRDAASWLGALRRPTPHVWALDQLARRDAHAVRTLTNLGRRLADAQGRAVRDREAGREMQELSRELQRAVDAAVRRGMEVLRDSGHGATTETALQMAATLRGVLAGDEAQRLELEEGRLLAPVPPPDAMFSGLISSPAETSSPDAGDDVAPPHTDSDPARGAALDAALQVAEQADRDLFERRTEQRRAEDALAAVRARLQDLQAELSAAEEQARAAAERVRAAVEAARSARREADRLQA